MRSILKSKTVKNLSLILNVILGAALVVLYVLHFSGDQDGDKLPESTDSTPAQSDFTIAYVLSDTLLQNYQYVIDENEKLRKRSSQIESDYRNRAEGLQKELTDYQANYGNLTIGQARAIEENLAKKEQNLRLFQESARQELLEMEAGISRELYTRVTEFLERHSQRNGIEMVVKFDASSDVLYAGKGLDITQQVIDSLNAKYLNGSSTPAASDSTAAN